MNYLPFNSVDHDRVYKAEDWAWYFSTFISNGVFPSPSDGLQVLAGDGMNVKVQPGFGFINGYAFRNREIYNLTLATADGSLARIDRIVLRWDLTTRSMYLAVLTGEASKNPEARQLTRGAEYWELALADVSITKGLTTVTQAQIKDQRYDSGLCGICAGVVTQIDATTLTKQFNAFFDQYQKTILSDYDGYTESIEAYEKAWQQALMDWQESQEQAMNAWTARQWQTFTDWLKECQDALGDVPAATLAAEITDHEERMQIMEHMILKNDFFAPVLDTEGNPILDDEGNVLTGEWKYNYQ